MSGQRTQETIMAKGQMRGNKEAKKPKKKKEGPSAAPAAASKASPLSIIPAKKKK
jgi:hypothetical protein